MREMKNSGIEWIGAIPIDWVIIKIKYITEIRSESGIFNPETDRYIGLENIQSYSNQCIETDTEYVEAIYSICKKGDVLFSKLRPYLVKTIIADCDCFCTGELMQFKSFLGIKKYLWFWFQNDLFIEIVNASTYGAKMPRANPNFIINLPMLFPPIEEQQQISDYLDSQCAEIDTLKADIQKQIETLEEYKRSVITEAVTKGLNPNAEMRDSGVEWIGEIPKHWEVDKLKFHLERNEPRNPGEVPVLSLYRELGVVLKDSRDDNHNVTSEDTSNYKYVRKGDFVVNKMKAWQGSVAVSNFDGIVSPAYFVFKFTDNYFNGLYFHYLLRSCYKDEFMRLSGGIRVGQWDLSADLLKNIPVLIPPIKEQQQIADYLDKKCTEIDSIISDKKQQLETIEEYKKSLIYEYVTGKREVQA